MSLFRSIACLVIVSLLAGCAVTTTPTPTAAPTTVLAQPTAAPTPQPLRQRPNILFILTDDLDVASTATMPKLKSLMIDQGTWFNNFFVNVSLCCPSRSTILRGQYSQGTQIYGNQPPDGGYEKFHSNGDEATTIAVWLQAAGYRTMLAGKYLNGYPNTVAQTFVPPGWTEWYSAAKGSAYSEYNYTLNENGKLVAYGNKPGDYGTDVYARKTVEFIQRSAQEGKPFFAYVSTYAPHGPSTPAPRHDKLFAKAQAPRTPNFNEEDVSDKPDYIRNRPSLTKKQIAQIDESYRKRLQSLQAVDEMIVQLIGTLEQAGQLDNTYIFFSSDNGFHLGNHRLDLGKVAPYEEEIHVPMVVRGPGVPAGRKLDHIVGNIDFAPTWAELAGIQTPDFVDGRSLVPLLKNNPPTLASWRQCYLLQHGDPAKQTAPDDDEEAYNYPPEMIGLLEPPDGLPSELAGDVFQRVGGITPYQAIRTQNYMYIEYSTGEQELYDLRVDPYQLKNLVPSARPEWLKELAARLHELSQCSGARCRAAENKPFTIP